jgi:hypothetical protein
MDCHHPWELPAQWWRPAEPPPGAWDGAAPACLEPDLNRLVPALADVLPKVRPGVGALLARLHETGRSAKAGADRKESDRVWGPAERAGLESEFRVG